MYPERARRNYRSFMDGFTKVSQEGALFRGATAHGLKLAGLVTISSAMLDWLKENMYFWFGPMWIVKYGGLAAGVASAMAVSMPFDNIATRLHTMRPLPNGQYPYEGTFDCFSKILKYECSFEK